MRNIIILAGLAGMAGIVLGDGGHPYQYETAVGWGDHSALVSNRQSPNPLRSRQAALAAILTPGVFAAIVSAAASIGVGTVQTTAVNNRVDETNRRVGTNENDIKKSKAEIKTLTDTSCTKTTCDAIKDTADKACTKTTCTDIKGVADKACTKDKCTEICMKVNEIFGKTAVGTADTDLGNVKNFKLTNILLTAGATANNVKTVTINGKELKAGDDGKQIAKENADVADDRVGITAKDFDLFREKVVAANTKLQQRIDQVLNDIVAINPCA